MARTPLLRNLLRLAETHRIAEARNTAPVAVRAARQATPSINRRQLLAGATLGAATVLLDPPSLEARPFERPPKIVIVGGGIAGLTAALRLRDLHLPCTVYEATGRLGGRMFSNSPAISGGAGYWAEGQVTEWCGELIDTGHRTIRTLARRFELTLDDLKAAEPQGATETIFFDGEYYQDADADFAPVYAAVQRDAKRAGYPTTYRRHTPAGVSLDALSVYDWIESRVPGGHGSKMGKLLDVAYTIEYGADTRDQSSLNLVYLLSGSGRTNLELFGESDERYHIRGGNQRLPLEIARALPAGTVVTGHRLTEFAWNPDRTITLTFQSSGRTSTVIADRVIFALPFAVLRKLDLAQAKFDARKLQAIRELGAGRNGKLMLQLASRFWSTTGAWGRGNGDTYADLPYQASWEATRAQPGNSGILVGYTGGPGVTQYAQTSTYTTSRDEVTAASAGALAAQLDQVFPGLAKEYNGKANLALPHLDPNYGCSYSYYRVGQYRQFAGYEKVRQHSIHFAGEHCSLDYQGYMEGGASEGLRAANEVAQLVRRF